MLFTFCSWILRFRDLQNYTTLKRQYVPEGFGTGFGGLQNYTTSSNTNLFTMPSGHPT